MPFSQAHLRGAYVVLGVPTDPSPAAFDAERERRLWEVADQLTRPVGASAST